MSSIHAIYNNKVKELTKLNDEDKLQEYMMECMPFLEKEMEIEMAGNQKKKGDFSILLFIGLA